MIEEIGIRKICLSGKLIASSLVFMVLGLVLILGAHAVLIGMVILVFFFLLFLLVPTYLKTTGEGIFCLKFFGTPKNQPILWKEITRIEKTEQYAGKGGTSYYVDITVANRKKYFPKTREKQKWSPVVRLSVGKRSKLDLQLRELWKGKSF